MRKSIVLVALLAFSFCIVAEKPIVVTTASMIADMAKNIGKDHVEIKCIVPIGGDPHTYKPTPNDAKLVAHANLILKNGLTFEGWLNELIGNSGTKANTVTVTEGINTIVSDKYKTPDPHAWMDPKNGVKYAENIANALGELLPMHKAEFQKNYQAYRAKLVETDQYIRKEIEKIPATKRFLITSHDAFQYYGKAYGLSLKSVLGTSTDADIQTKDVIELQKVIKSAKVPAVFIESTVNPKTLKQIAADAGAVIGGKLLSDSLGDEALGGTTYISMLKQNTDVIVKGLTEAKPAEETVTKAPIGGSSQNGRLITIFLGSLFALGLFYMFRKTKKYEA